MVRRLMSSMTSHDSMPPCSWRHNIQSRRIQKLGPVSTILVETLNIVLKHQLIRPRTLGVEAFGVTLPQVKTANNRYCCSSMGTRGSLKTLQRASQFGLSVETYQIDIKPAQLEAKFRTFTQFQPETEHISQCSRAT